VVTTMLRVNRETKIEALSGTDSFGMVGFPADS